MSGSEHSKSTECDAQPLKSPIMILGVSISIVVVFFITSYMWVTLWGIGCCIDLGLSHYEIMKREVGAWAPIPLLGLAASLLGFGIIRSNRKAAIAAVVLYLLFPVGVLFSFLLGLVLQVD